MAINTVQAQLLSGIEGIDFDAITLNPTEDGYYTAQITAPAMSSYNLDEHVFNIKITATTVGGMEDSVDKTDETLGENCKLRVIEKIAPVVSIVSPGGNDAFLTNSSVEIKFSMTDSHYGGIKDSGLDTNSFSFILSKGSENVEIPYSDITYLEGEGLYSYSSNVGDGRYSLTISISDFDGNMSNVATKTFTVDTAAPSIELSAPEISNVKQVTITGKTDADDTVTITISVNGTALEPFNPEASGNFTKEVELVEGENEITAYATDVSGNNSDIARVTVFVDTSVPVFKEVILEPNPVDGGATLILKVKVVAQV